MSRKLKNHVVSQVIQKMILRILGLSNRYTALYHILTPSPHEVSYHESIPDLSKRITNLFHSYHEYIHTSLYIMCIPQLTRESQIIFHSCCEYIYTSLYIVHILWLIRGSQIFISFISRLQTCSGIWTHNLKFMIMMSH